MIWSVLVGCVAYHLDNNKTLISYSVIIIERICLKNLFYMESSIQDPYEYLYTPLKHAIY